MPRSISLAVAAALLLISVLAPSAVAHAELDISIPAAGAEIEGSPPELVTTWTQDLDPSRTSLDVRDAADRSVAKGGSLGDGPREFRLALPTLAPGTYEVRWTSFSAEDGELARGTFEFTIRAVATPRPVPTAQPSPSPARTPRATEAPIPTPAPTPTPTASPVPSESSSGSDVLVPILAAAMIIGALAIWMRRRR